MIKRVLWMLLALSLCMTTFVMAEDSAPDEEAGSLVVVTEDAEPEVIRLRKAGTIFLQLGNYAAVTEGKLTWIDLANKNVIPYIKEDRTMVPLRFLTESLGATVGYNAETRGITVTLGDTVMELTVGETTYFLNGEAFEMDCAAEILEDRTFVPVRFVSEALGKAVKWLGTERMVVITDVTSPWDEAGSVEQAVLAQVRLNLSPLGRNNIR
ncbi:MAG: copper amine oxidase N-terminal domain-containing protein [Clostridia bacterium]|nr:copper amine oxidase N-terminal domain-containing protein [Clostridia bacterium]